MAPVFGYAYVVYAWSASGSWTDDPRRDGPQFPYFFLDTTTLSNGMHTIGWLVYDDLGRGEGLGSRFFWVQN